MNNEIQIYVADLAAYNNGKLHGMWIDTTQSVDEIFDIIKTLLESSPEEDAEEFAIHDHEGFSFRNLAVISHGRGIAPQPL